MKLLQLVGYYETPIDDKRRVTLASEFGIRKTTIYISKSKIGGNNALELITTLPEVSPAAKALERVREYASFTNVQIDRQSRLVIPERLLKHLKTRRKKLEKIVQSGCRDRVYFWNPADFYQIFRK